MHHQVSQQPTGPTSTPAFPRGAPRSRQVRQIQAHDAGERLQVEGQKGSKGMRRCSCVGTGIQRSFLQKFGLPRVRVILGGATLWGPMRLCRCWRRPDFLAFQVQIAIAPEGVYGPLVQLIAFTRAILSKGLLRRQQDTRVVSALGDGKIRTSSTCHLAHISIDRASVSPCLKRKRV